MPDALDITRMKYPTGVYVCGDVTIECASEIIGTYCLVQKDGHSRVCAQADLEKAIEYVEDECIKDVFNKLKE